MKNYDGHVIHFIASPPIKEMRTGGIRLSKLCSIFLCELRENRTCIFLFRFSLPVERFPYFLVDQEKFLTRFTCPCQIKHEQRHNWFFALTVVIVNQLLCRLGVVEIISNLHISIVLWLITFHKVSFFSLGKERIVHFEGIYNKPNLMKKLFKEV